MGGHRAWLTQSWLLTVMSLLQEGEALLEEQNHLPDVVHAADVVALQEGAEEQLGGLPAAERASPSAETSGGPSEPLDYPSVREQLDEHDGRGGGSAAPSRGGVLQTNGAPPPRGGAQT